MMFWPLPSHRGPNKSMDPPYGNFAVSQSIPAENILDHWENARNGSLTWNMGHYDKNIQVKGPELPLSTKTVNPKEMPH